MPAINEDAALHVRAQAMVDRLTAYELSHPGQGPDADGRPYDPWRDVIRDPFVDGSDGARAEIDEVRSAAIPTRTWEGFAWANHRFVLSDKRGNSVIVGYNEDASKWFVDSTTPVRLPAEWVAQYMQGYDPEGRITGLEDPRDVHDTIVGTFGATGSTVPSEAEVEDYLRARRSQ